MTPEELAVLIRAEAIRIIREEMTLHIEMGDHCAAYSNYSSVKAIVTLKIDDEVIRTGEDSMSIYICEAAYEG